jgi:transglutaminase-like putative cysteine protease
VSERPNPLRSRLLLLAELSLTGATVVAVLALGRLFEDRPYVPKVVASAVAAHVIAIVCRRLGLTTALTFVVSAIGAVFVLSWVHLPETTNYGIPSSRTLDEAQTQLQEAWRAFGDVVAPAPALPGFLLSCSIASWVIALVADTAAFRARAAVEAIVPATALFIFGGALGAGPQRWGLSALFVAAVLVHWLAQRSYNAASSTTWLAVEGSGVGSMLRTGGVLVVAGAVAAVLIGPNLPGANADSLIKWRAEDLDRPSARVTVSPLVDIRTRLVDQANVEVFRVSSTQRAYWRLTSLEQFDGRIWSSNRHYRPAKGTLGSDVDNSQAQGETVTQHFAIDALSSFWLPAAFHPKHIEGTGARYDIDSNSLLTEEETANGLSYDVESVVPSLQPAQLMAVPAVAPQHIVDEYTALPDDFSPAVRRLALQIVSGRGLTTQYERAKALQDYLRRPPFVYDLSVQPGHSGSDLENFLFRTRRGYCEQYAGAYAAMARVIGLPARVAVGFTPGESDGNGNFVVHGFNGHAWPEVYLDGYGWVAFEPTPGRGMPGAQSYTGVPEQQADPANPNVGTTSTTNTTVAAGGGAGTTTTSAPPNASTGAPQDEQHHSSPWPRRILVAILAVVLIPLLWAGLLAAIRRLRRRRRTQAATTPESRVLLAWDEVTEALALAGTPRQPWETPVEYARRAGSATGIDRESLRRLAGAATVAGFHPNGVSSTAAEDAVLSSVTLQRAATELVDRRGRLRLLVDPRPLLRHDDRVTVDQ